MQKTHLLVIDPQRDFCNPDGALFVPGADEDMRRLAAMVGRVKNKLDAIHVTLDSHHLIDIAHPIFWKDADGAAPNPFTIITASDVENNVWRASNIRCQQRAFDYVKALEANQRYPLCIWPPHCLIGSEGAAVTVELFDAILKWEGNFEIANFVTKGSNPWTEHYSAVKADVPDPSDVTTQLNTGLIKTLEEADVILVAGEAGSHCLANTILDIANSFSDDSYIGKLVLLEDATSPVPGFENLQEDFVKEMTSRGMKLSTTIDWMA